MCHGGLGHDYVDRPERPRPHRGAAQERSGRTRRRSPGAVRGTRVPAGGPGAPGHRSAHVLELLERADAGGGFQDRFWLQASARWSPRSRHRWTRCWRVGVARGVNALVLSGSYGNLHSAGPRAGAAGHRFSGRGTGDGHGPNRALRTAALGLTLGDESCCREPPFGALSKVAGRDRLRVGGGDAIEGGGPDV